MILAFRDQFVPYVLDGSKTHSIRAGKRWREGMRVDLYEKSRQRKKFELKLSGGSKGCICHGDGLFGMKCTAKEHSVYEQVQVAGMRLLFRAPLRRVEGIKISIEKYHRPDGAIWRPQVVISETILTLDETELFFWRDGFRGTHMSACQQAMAHWRGKFPFSGQLIHWDYEAREPK